jgi:hypothetical protein
VLTLLCEIDDIRRPITRALMTYFGPVPMEHSSGNYERRAHHQSRQHPRPATPRRGGLEQPSSHGADLILRRRRQDNRPRSSPSRSKPSTGSIGKFHRLDQRKHRHVAITAVARRLCGFVWAILEASAPVRNALRRHLNTSRGEPDRRILV